MFALEIPFDPSKRFPGLGDFKAPIRVGWPGGPPRSRSEILDGCPDTLAQNALKSWRRGVHDHASGSWHDTYQMVKLPLYVSQIAEDVSMVELQIVQNGGFRAVMNEFGALVKKSGVVLVCLNDKQGRIRQSGRDWEVAGHAAD